MRGHCEGFARYKFYKAKEWLERSVKLRYRLVMRFLTTFLFAVPRFSFGLARALDLGATFTSLNVSRTGAEADAKAVFSDWYMTSRDLLDAMHQADLEGCWHNAQEEAIPTTTESIIAK